MNKPDSPDRALLLNISQGSYLLIRNVNFWKNSVPRMETLNLILKDNVSSSVARLLGGGGGSK